MSRLILLFCCAGMMFPASGFAQSDILRIAKSFEDGGHYTLSGSGTSEEIRFENNRILPAGTNGTYCSGFTFNVVMRAAEERGLLKNKSVEQIKKFQKEWYGVTSDTEKQAGPSLQNLGIGKSISADEAKPGDFLQLWRTKSGHSVVFLRWVEENGKRVGFNYRSTQKSTYGIGNNTEYFSDVPEHKGTVDRNRIYFARLNPK